VSSGRNSYVGLTPAPALSLPSGGEGGWGRNVCFLVNSSEKSLCLTVLLQRSAEEKWEQIVGPTSYLYGSESVGGAHVIGGRGLSLSVLHTCSGITQ